MMKIFSKVFAKIENAETEESFPALYTITADPMISLAG
jgi:hypothetical protein